MGKEVERNMRSTVTVDDIAYILGESTKYTWDEFYRTLDMERASGAPHCPQASYIALELMKPRLMQLPWRSARTNSETHNDYFQDAYLTIMEHIDDFDRTQAKFETFIMKWFQGLAREVRNDGISEYQNKKKGVRIWSADAAVTKNGMDGGNESTFELVDEDSSVEDVYERKEKERSNRLFEQIMGEDIEPEEEAEMRNAYVNAACYNLFLGGIENLPDAVKDELEEMVVQ